MKSKIKTPPFWKLILKFIVVLFICLFWLATGHVWLEMIRDRTDYYYNKADVRRSCDYYYYDKNFGALREMFTLYDLQEEEFDIYREAVKCFEDYQDYRMYENAAAAGVEGAKEMAEQYRAAVLENADNCAFDRNQKDLDSYVDNIS